MTDQRRSILVLPFALAALLGLYTGAYYLTVQTIGVRSGGRIQFSFPVYALPRGFMHLIGRLARFFALMHRLDRRIRPHVWDAETVVRVRSPRFSN